MKHNAWTLALVSAGLVSLPAVTHADETPAAVPVLTALSSTTISGYVDTSAHWNPGTGNANLPGYSANGASGSSKADGFNLNVLALTLNKPATEGDWAAGYNATVLVGPDARGYNTIGTDGTSQLSVKDVYIDLHAPVGNGLDIKVGNFTTPLGYEVYEDGNNPNYTRSYGYAIEPSQLVGALASYTFCSALSANVGIGNTWNAGLDNRANAVGGAESSKAYLGSLTLTAPKELGFLAGSTLTGGIQNGVDTAAGKNKTSYYAGAVLNTPLNSLKVGLSYDYCEFGNSAYGTATVGSRYQNATAVYLAYKATEKLTLNTRGEYFSQSKALVTSGMGSSVFAVTETVQYDLWKNVISRLEFRWDHSEHDTVYSSGANQDNAFLIAANLIYKF